jgi:hypothetical protein
VVWCAMPPPPLKRHIKSPDRDWVRCLVDAGYEPDPILTWVEENLNGRWSHKSASRQDVIAELNEDPGDRFFLVLYFEQHQDLDRFLLWHNEASGSA